MTVKWADLRQRALLTLDDTKRSDDEDLAFGPDWSYDDLLMYLGHALAEVATHTAEGKIYTLPLTAAVSSLTVPDDVLKVAAVMVRNGTTIKLQTSVELEPGQEFPQASSAGDRANFYEWPTGTLNFLNPIASGNELRVHYWAYWQLPGTAQDLLTIPRWMEEPVYWLLQEQAVAKTGFSAARLGQFKTRDDAGRPQDNPLLEYARYCRRRYELLMANHPTQDRSGWEA